jgi:hypothetical protein
MSIGHNLNLFHEKRFEVDMTGQSTFQPDHTALLFVLNEGATFNFIIPRVITP